jgi:hypothetical protein
MPDTEALSPADEAVLRDEAVSEGSAPAEAPAEPIPSAEPEAAPPPAEPAGAETEKPAKMVPLPALQEARREAKEAKDLARRMEERFQRFLAEQAAPKPPAAPEIDPHATPLEAVVELWNDRFQERQQKAQQSQQNNQFNALVTAYRQKAMEFAQDNADFGDAYRHWQEGVAAELVDAMGYADPQAISSEIQRYETAIVQKAFADGVNPAERLYKAAQRRGYAKAQPKPTADPSQQARDQVETVQRGQKAAASLSTASGAAPEGLSLKRLAEMDEDEFAKATEGNAWRKLWQ